MRFTCVEAGKEDAGRIADFIGAVWQQMEQKGWFAVEDVHYLTGLMEAGKGLAWKMMEEESGRLAGVCFVAIPGMDEDNLGYDIGLKGEELLQVAHMDIAAVATEFRGNRLQQRMVEVAEERLASLGYTKLMCTIHPENTFSSSTMERRGYRLVKQAYKYGGLLRNIYLKQL